MTARDYEKIVVRPTKESQQRMPFERGVRSEKRQLHHNGSFCKLVTQLWCLCVLLSSKGWDINSNSEFIHWNSIRHCSCSGDEDDLCVRSASSD